MRTRREHHFIVLHDTETNRWYIAEAGDFLSEGCVWDKDREDWMDWDESCNDEAYRKDYQFLERNLMDYNVFADTYLDTTPKK